MRTATLLCVYPCMSDVVVIAGSTSVKPSYYWILLVIGAAPLLIYPFVLLANVMSMAATRVPSQPPVPLMQNLTCNAFLWSSTLYPIVYAVCALAAVMCSRSGGVTMAWVLAAGPVAYLVLCALLLAAWIVSSP